MLLLGTTDTEHDGEPDTVSVSDTDVEEVLAEASVAVDGLGPPRATFCGLRVLPGGDGGTASAKRETVFSTGPTGMVSVAGGKLTTYRRIALDALGQLGVRGLSKRPRPLPGATGLDRIALAGRASTPRRATICCTCTARSRSRCSPPPPTIRRSSSRSSPAARTCARRSSTRAAHEWARTEEDVFRRRTTAWLAASEVPV